MGFSHLPGTPEPLPPPYPVAILCSGRSCLGSPTLCSLDDRKLDAYFFLVFTVILLIPAYYLCSWCCLPPECSPWPYLPTWGLMGKKRNLGFSLSSTLSGVDLGKFFNFLEFQFPLGKWGKQSFQHRLLWGIRWDNVHTGLTQEICSCWFSSSNPLSKGQFSSASISATFLLATSDIVHMYLLSNSFCNYYMYQIINNLIYIFYFQIEPYGFVSYYMIL